MVPSSPCRQWSCRYGDNIVYCMHGVMLRNIIFLFGYNKYHSYIILWLAIYLTWSIWMVVDQYRRGKRRCSWRDNGSSSMFGYVREQSRSPSPIPSYRTHTSDHVKHGCSVPGFTLDNNYIPKRLPPLFNYNTAATSQLIRGLLHRGHLWMSFILHFG